MIDTKTLVLLSEYNAWADDVLFAALRQLPDGSAYEDIRTLFKTIVGTLNHNYQVDLIWKANLCSESHGFKSRRDLLHPSLDDLVPAQSELNQWYVDWAERQTSASLEEAVEFQFTNGSVSEMQRGAMFLHVINHKTFHRGWVSQMFFDFGSRPPQTDISVYLTEGHVAGPAN